MGDEPLRTSSSTTPLRGATLITGGAGFIGTHLAGRLLAEGREVLLLDNLARPDVKRNLEHLLAHHTGLLLPLFADVRDALAVRDAVQRASSVIHLAAAAPSPASARIDPVLDFDVNVRGTLHVLEALRVIPEPPPLLFASSSRVYGGGAALGLDETERRHQPRDATCREHGIDEQQALLLPGPGDCSKGAADQYVLAYARHFGLTAVVLRLGSVYGPYQLETSGHGWVAQLLRAAVAGTPVVLGGDGKQVRDALHVDDLVDAVLAIESAGWTALSGQAFNVGGGAQRSASPLELVELLAGMGLPRPLLTSGTEESDGSRYDVSDTRRFAALTGWRPAVGLGEGLERLHTWMRSQPGQQRAWPAASAAQEALWQEAPR